MLLTDVQRFTSVNVNQNLLVTLTFGKRRNLICTPHKINDICDQTELFSYVNKHTREISKTYIYFITASTFV